MNRGDPGSDPNLTTVLVRLVQGVGKLVADHLALARLELGQDARTIGGRLATIAVLVPFVVIGYALVRVGLAVFSVPG